MGDRASRAARRGDRLRDPTASLPPMPLAVVTGSGGLIGSESVEYFAKEGFDVIGIDNDMRSYFFGDEASTRSTSDRLAAELGSSFRALDLDIRDTKGIDRLFAEHGRSIELIVPTAA